MDERFIKLDHIDTSVAAKNFSELLYEKKTYFLNGSWGSGKTEFLEEVKKNSQHKLITIDFWRLTDSRSTIEIVFSKLHPFAYWGFRILLVLCVAVSILMTNVVDLGLSNLWGDTKPVILQIGGIIALVVAIWQVFKKKSDEWYSYLLEKFPKRSKVLVIDDFDRMSEKQQEESYKVFSLINGKLPIVFVGDIEKVYKNENNYLSKIIDRQVELPFDLHPENIWDSYFERLGHEFGNTFSTALKNTCISEGRNLRDRQRFNDYVNSVFFARHKLGYVQVEQQLLIIYLYLFHVDIYTKLLKGTFNFNDEEMFGIEGTIKNILREQNISYPMGYLKNKKNYLIYEASSNRSENEMKELFSSFESDTFKNEFFNSSYNSDFYNYLESKISFFKNEKIKQLFENSLKECIKKPVNPSINLVISKYMENEKFQYDIYNRAYPSDNNEVVFEKWKSIFNNLNFDLSEQIYLLRKLRILSFYDYVDLQDNYNESWFDNVFERIKQFKRKDCILLIYFLRFDAHDLPDFYDIDTWEDWIFYDIAREIKEFSPREFLLFFSEINVLSNRIEDYTGFDVIPEDKTYILWPNQQHQMESEKLSENRERIKGLIQPKLDELRSAGYTFIEKVDERGRVTD